MSWWQAKHCGTCEGFVLAAFNKALPFACLFGLRCPLGFGATAGGEIGLTGDTGAFYLNFKDYFVIMA